MNISSLILDFDICELDPVDKKIILLITEGCSSSYSIWVAMKNESKTKQNASKTLVYKNIYQRTIALSNAGYLQELKVEGKNIHGRREYKVTIKGLQQLLLYYVNHPEEIMTLNRYLDKAKIDKQPFTIWLAKMSAAVVYLANEHNHYIEEHIEFEYKDGKYTRMNFVPTPAKSKSKSKKA